MQRVRDVRRGEGQVKVPADAADSGASSGLHFSDPHVQRHLEQPVRHAAQA